MKVTTAIPYSRNPETSRSAGRQHLTLCLTTLCVGRSVVRLDITGMMCTKSCTPTVQKALEEVDGVESANVSLENKCAWVKVECLLPSSSGRDPELIVRPPGGWQGTASPDVLIAAVNAAGGKGKFEATLHVEDE